MKLIINTPGTYLHKRDKCFLMERKNEKSEISSKKVQQILITTHASISTDAIELAVENNIDIVFLKNSGEPLGRIWHSKLGSITTIRRKQLLLQDHQLGLSLVQEWICQKLKNQIEHLNELAMNRRDEEKRNLIKNTISQISDYIKKLSSIESTKTVEDVRETIQGYEGNASRAYFSALGKLIPPKYEFSSRSKHPATDYFNCFLNYSYGILYSSVEKACIIAGLDPYIGIMHTDNYNKKSLVYDLVEMYRCYMDKLVFKLFTTKKVDDSHVTIVKEGFYLNQEGKKVLISDYNNLIEKQIRYKGRNIEFGNIIQYDCHQIANKILKMEL